MNRFTTFPNNCHGPKVLEDATGNIKQHSETSYYCLWMIFKYQKSYMWNNIYSDILYSTSYALCNWILFYKNIPCEIAYVILNQSDRESLKSWQPDLNHNVK